MPGGVKRAATSSSASPRTAWFPIVTKVGGKYGLDIGWKFYDNTVGFFSTARNNCDVKPPWGEIVSSEFNRVLNDLGEPEDYFRLQNFKGQRCNFKIGLLNHKYFGVNEFTQFILSLRAGGKVLLLGKFLGILTRAEGFLHHDPDLHTESGLLKDGSDDLRDEEEAEALGFFVRYAREAAIIVENKKDALNHLLVSKKKEKGDSTPCIKKSKAEKMIDDKKAELEDKDGVEKSYNDNYVGRAEINIDNISVSEKLSIPIIPFKVCGLAQAMLTQFDPSLVSLTVYPADMKDFDTNNLGRNKYKLIHGNHRYMALKQLDSRGLLSKLPGLEDRDLVCHIVEVKGASDIAFGNLRGNELASKYQRKPFVHELLFVMDSFYQTYKNKDKALELVLRFAKVLSVHPDEITALKRMGHWKSDCFQTLISVLKKFEVYQTSDCKENLDRNNKRLMEGQKLKVTISMFKSISKCDPEYFKENSQKVLDKKISLQNLLENVGKDLGRKKAMKIVTTLTNYQSPEQLELRYPGKFTEELFDRYKGAAIGKSANVKGNLLRNYCKSVLNEKENREPVKVVCIGSLAEISKDALEEYDVLILNLSVFDEVPKTAIEVALYSAKPAISVLILLPDEKGLTEALTYLAVFQKPKEFVVKPIFFEAENPKVVEGFLMNATYGVLLGKVAVLEPPLKVLNGGLNACLREFVSKVTPLDAKIAFLNAGGLPVIKIHTDQRDTEVVYYGNKKTLDKLLNQRVKDRGVIGMTHLTKALAGNDQLEISSIERRRSIPSSFDYAKEMEVIQSKIDSESSADDSLEEAEDDVQTVTNEEETDEMMDELLNSPPMKRGYNKKEDIEETDEEKKEMAEERDGEKEELTEEKNEDERNAPKERDDEQKEQTEETDDSKRVIIQGNGRDDVKAEIKLVNLDKEETGGRGEDMKEESFKKEVVHVDENGNQENV